MTEHYAISFLQKNDIGFYIARRLKTEKYRFEGSSLKWKMSIILLFKYAFLRKHTDSRQCHLKTWYVQFVANLSRFDINELAQKDAAI